MAPADAQNRHGPARAPHNGHRGRAPDMAGPPDASTVHRRNEESWVEIASQPSSSSLSSIGDEIVTTGLRVANSSYPPRRRRLHQQPTSMPQSYIVGHPPAVAGTSSQEEYDETESEEDRVMTSSTEQVHPAAALPRQQTAVRAVVDSDTDSDDDENATALGRPSNSPTFRPQPNAFSHPPSHLTHRHSTSSVHPYRPSQSRPGLAGRSHTRGPRGSPDYLSPAFQADNDAALRASLTTLLSCAAAARGLPKKDDPRAGPPTIGGIGAGAGVLPGSQPMELRLVPESELMGEMPASAPPGPRPGPIKVPARTASNSSAPSAPSSTPSQEPAIVEKTKRGAASQGKSQRATKKKKTGTLVDGEPTTLISPTLLTWVVSAGVVVLVSVVGFGAGYVIGREVGRQEAGMGLGSATAGSNASATCGRDLVKSTSSGTLKRFRWGSMGKSITA
ncbi:hypothetical protein QBC47DRAFT_376033 [Echria macrotheca]|uniref:Uncharacterized protein n=1 Tax=Echria macrotheca TaxID=438768 RepID=A0AAJ0F704_9PEZI|nr:hypothetical protein QBC47DRAFT_376033 [Echria macrotheca]